MHSHTTTSYANMGAHEARPFNAPNHDASNTPRGGLTLRSQPMPCAHLQCAHLQVQPYQRAVLASGADNHNRAAACISSGVWWSSGCSPMGESTLGVRWVRLCGGGSRARHRGRRLRLVRGKECRRKMAGWQSIKLEAFARNVVGGHLPEELLEQAHHQQACWDT